jgi:hypothetical protein
MIRFIQNHKIDVVIYKGFIFNNLHYLIAQRVYLFFW